MCGDLWLKRVLIPLWAAQLLCRVILVISLGASLAVLHHVDDFASDGQYEYSSYDDSRG